MPPSSWSSRLLSNGTPSSSSSATPTRSPTSNRPLPRPPNELLDPPTLHPERAVASSPRPQPVSRKEHTRSSSNPLPKIFGRKKSSGQLKYEDAEAALDDDPVPAMGEPIRPLPARALSGKKGRLEDEVKTQRVCMCCHSKVMVPKGLGRFRCLCCLTINDLKPAEEQSEDDKGRPHMQRAETDPMAGRPALRMPLSVERTLAIIDQCLITYLETRSKRLAEIEELSKAGSTKEDVFSQEQRSPKVDMRPRQEPRTVEQLRDTPVSSSPPDAPGASSGSGRPNAATRDFGDFDLFVGTRNDTQPPDPKLPADGSGTPKVISRKPVPAQPSRKPPPPPVDIAGKTASQRLHPSGGLGLTGPTSPRPGMSPRLTAVEMEQRRRYDRVKTIFRPLEDYLQSHFGDFHCLNSSFSTFRPTMTGRTRSESNIPTPPPELIGDFQPSPIDGLSEMDAKTLLLGDIGENGSWWTGRFERSRSGKAAKRKRLAGGSQKPVSSKSPNINWSEVAHWYDIVHTVGADWRAKVDVETSGDVGTPKLDLGDDVDVNNIGSDLSEARDHVVRTLLKITEALLKQPKRPIKEPADLRFLLILLSNPSLYPRRVHRPAPSAGSPAAPRIASDKHGAAPQSNGRPSPNHKTSSQENGRHTGLLKRIFGLLANAPEPCHRYLTDWFARFDERHFVKTVDLVASFVTHRIGRRSGRPRSRSAVQDGGLIPDLSGSAMNTSAQLHSAMGLSGSVKSRAEQNDAAPDWTEDWQLRAAAKMMSLLFSANNIWQGSPRDADAMKADLSDPTPGLPPQAKARRSGQLLHTSSFYNSLLDYQDMIADFKVWESKREKFSFCQFPLFLSMGTKIKILEHDARRQMELKAREAYFDQIIRQRAIDGHFHLRIRRDCMVEDSFRQISEAVGAGQEELKKGLRVHFTGEEGVDAGGLRKEWFLLLVRDIFSPNHGMFVYDDESNTCYFNPNSFETSDQYFLVGALLGLAIYNSTILDVAFPPFAFRKLLAAAPSAASSNVSSLTGTKGQMTYTIADLAEFRPSLAAGLQQLLEFNGDVEATYCRDFVAPVEIYGTVKDIPLIHNGEKTPVTNSNRHEFVDAYVRYLLDTAVARQFEPFKRGFFTVCAGNALTLFRAEEIELLIRGSDEALDVDSLRAVAVYEGWKHFQPPHHPIPRPDEDVPVIGWFWELFAEATPEKQRKLLTFITGTDRIPAVGATSLVLRIVAGGDGWGGGGRAERERFPVARTCFNMLILWRYGYREQLEQKLWRAVDESEGFGLK